MDFETIISTDSSRAVSELAAEKVGNCPENFKHIINLVLTKPHPISSRAARVIDICSERHPHLIKPYLNQLIVITTVTKSDWIKRSSLRIFERHIEAHNINYFGELVDTCFRFLNSAHESIAVRVYSMMVLQKVCLFEPDLSHELIGSIEMQYPYSSPGFKSMAKKILSYWRNNKRFCTRSKF